MEVGYLGMLAAGMQSALLAYNQIYYPNLPANLSPFTAAGRTLLNSQVGSAAAGAAGVTAPWSGFNKLWGTGATVAQSLRPFPQYSTVDTINGQGDRIGHSTYHSMQVKFSKRYSCRPDRPGVVRAFEAADRRGQRRQHARGPLQPQSGKVDRVLRPDARREDELRLRAAFRQRQDVPDPEGRGQPRLSAAGASPAFRTYSSGTPFGLGHHRQFPDLQRRQPADRRDLRRLARRHRRSKFDPAVDKFLQPVSFFGTQPTDRLGTMTRYNPKLRNLPGYQREPVRGAQHHTSRSRSAWSSGGRHSIS